MVCARCKKLSLRLTSPRRGFTSCVCARVRSCAVFRALKVEDASGIVLASMDTVLSIVRCSRLRLESGAM